MKLAFIITGLGLGGAEKQVSALIDEFKSQDDEIILISLTGETIVTPKDQTIKIYSLMMKKNPWSQLVAAYTIIKTLRNFKPDVIHSHMFHANILARIYRLFCLPNALICTAHNTNEGGFFHALAYRITDRLASKTTNVSQEAVDAFVRLKAAPAHRISTVHNGIDTQLFHFNLADRKSIRDSLGLDKDTSVFINIGRFHPQKDHKNLITAFSQLKEEKRILLLVGDGPLRNEIESTITALEMTDKIKLLGARNDIPALLSASDVFVLSSAYEGFPLVVGEAMACERVVVATNCGGPKEFLGDCGFIIPPADAQALARGLEQAILLSKDEKEIAGKAARQRVISYFSLNAAVAEWKKLYRTVSLKTKSA